MWSADQILKALYFGLQRAIGSRVGHAWQAFLEWERLSPWELELRVEATLEDLLTHAVSTVPYYRALGLERRSGENAREFLARFPVLGREEVRAHFVKLIADEFRGQIHSPSSRPRFGYGWTVVSTGGTTGTPTSVIHDASCRDWGRASRLYSQAQCGFPLPTPYFRLWGSQEDLLQQQRRPERRIISALLRERPMNAFRSSREALLGHWATLREHQHIRHMMAYIDVATMLAEMIDESGIARPTLDTIMACAGTVTPEARALLERVFRAQVFDKYGSRECADIACECMHHSGLHVYSPHVFVEIVDENGFACPPGQPGRVLITMLRNRTFVMLRYEIGDYAAWAGGWCTCGSPFPRLARIEGRTDEWLTAPDGSSVSPNVVRHFVGVSLNRHMIREWQFVQYGINSFVFRYVPESNCDAKGNVQAIVAAFRRVLGSEAKIVTEDVEELPVATSGKRRWIINTLRASQTPGH